MLKLFHHVRNKIKERERDRKSKEKQSVMQLKVDEANRLVASLNVTRKYEIIVPKLESHHEPETRGKSV